MQTRDEYVTMKKKELDDWKQEMAVLDVKVQQSEDAAKAKYAKKLADLRDMRFDNERKIEAIKSAAEGSWEILKAETEKTWIALKDAVTQFKSHFK
jgi:hypothetical protein